MLKVYGVSDDLVEVEGADYPYDEIGCFEHDVRLKFNDGAVIRVSYPKGDMAVWEITIENQGRAPYRFTPCFDQDAEIYSDIFEIAAGLESCEVIKK